MVTLSPNCGIKENLFDVLLSLGFVAITIGVLFTFECADNVEISLLWRFENAPVWQCQTIVYLGCLNSRHSEL